MSGASDFGAELRRLRQATGKTLRKFSEDTYVSLSQLSKLENGKAQPNRDVAKELDRALASEGLLARLIPLEKRTPVRPQPVRIEDVPVMPPGDEEDQAAGLLDLQQTFDSIRRSGHRRRPAYVLDLLTPALAEARAFAKSIEVGGFRREAVLLTARYSEYAGWMAQEVGEDGNAAWYTEYAAKLAGSVGDHDFVRYTHVRAADIALYRRDPLAVIRYAQLAQLDPLISAHVRGMAAQREAQGYAMAGQLGEFHEAMDRAQALYELSIEEGTAESFGTGSLVNPIRMLSGWALHDLCRYAEAAVLLDEQVALMPANSVRGRTRYGIRCAFAYLCSGELERAAEILLPLLEDALRADSATIRLDLVAFQARLHKYGSNRLALDLGYKIQPVLYDPR